MSGSIVYLADDKLKNRRSTGDRNNKKINTVKKIIGFIGGVAFLILMAAGLAILPTKITELLESEPEDQKKTEIIVRAELKDANLGGEITSNVKSYVADLEKTLDKYGLELIQAEIPQGKMRELNLKIAEESGIAKVNMMRSISGTAADINELYEKLDEEGIKVDYIDVRVAKRGIFKRIDGVVDERE